MFLPKAQVFKLFPYFASKRSKVWGKQLKLSFFSCLVSLILFRNPLQILFKLVITWSRLVGKKFCCVLPGSRQCYKLFINYTLQLYVKSFIPEGGIPYFSAGIPLCRDEIFPCKKIYRGTFQKIVVISIVFLRSIWRQSVRKKLTNVFVEFYHFVNIFKSTGIYGFL